MNGYDFSGMSQYYPMGSMTNNMGNWGLEGIGSTRGTSLFTPNAPGLTDNSFMGGSGFGLNMPTMELGLKGLSAIGGLWGAFNANKMAKQQFGFMKDVTNANLNNSISSYNTRLGDQARSRRAIEGQTMEQMQEYIDRNKLSR